MNDGFWRAPCKGGAFQWVQAPPGNRSSRKHRIGKREFNLSSPMSASRARRVRNRFLTVGLLVSAVTFVVIEGDALVDQSQLGHASALFMFGTACLAAAACVVLFAIITAIGLAVSAAFSDEPPQQQSDRIQEGGNGSVLLAPWPKTSARLHLRHERQEGLAKVSQEQKESVTTQ